MADSRATGNPLAAVLDRLAELETRQQERSFDELRSAVLAASEGAWEAFVEKYSKFAYSVALRMLAGVRDRQEREEAAAAIYARTFERLADGDFRILRGFGGRCRFTTYLFRIVQSEKKEFFRKVRSVREDPAPDDAEAVADPSRRAEPLLRPEHVEALVREAVERLDPEQKLLLVCRFRDGLKLREIATMFGLKDTNAAARATYAAVRNLEPIRASGAARGFGEAEFAAIEHTLRAELFGPDGASDTRAGDSS